MRLVKRLMELAFFVFLLTLFAKNMDVSFALKYYGLKEPIRVAFWELVIFCVSFGIIVAALGDFITQVKWIGERRRMIRTDKEHASEVQALTDRVKGLESENQRLTEDKSAVKSDIQRLNQEKSALESENHKLRMELEGKPKAGPGDPDFRGKSSF